MQQAVVQAPGDYVSGPVGGSVAAERQGQALAAEPGHQVRYAAVIDVAVGTFHSPLLRVGREVATHVLVHRLL